MPMVVGTGEPRSLEDMDRREEEHDVDEAASAPRRTPFRRFGGRGGGPPGGSAFQRLTGAAPASGTRRITATPAAAPTLDAITDTGPAPTAFTEPPRARPTSARPGPGNDALDADPLASGHDDAEPLSGFDANAFDPSWLDAEREASARRSGAADAPLSSEGTEPSDRSAERKGTTTTMFPTSSATRVFPGGQARLPKLGVVGDSRVHFVGTAFIRRPDDEEDETGRTAFDEYFTFESLFEEPPAQTPASTKPYEILEVDPDSPWSEVVAAHRRLAKLHHPDALVDADPRAVAAAEERFRQINWAYGELSRRRRGRSPREQRTEEES